MIRVLVVDDSPVTVELLRSVLATDPDLEVVASVADGAEAVAAAGRLLPDVITMDIHLPGLDGFEATRRIMSSHPAPIVIVSASSRASGDHYAFMALEAGALTVVASPPGPGHPLHRERARELCRTVKLMAEVKVVRRWAVATCSQPPVDPVFRPTLPAVVPAVVAIGASTGGPPVLKTILAALPRSFPTPIVIAQHIADGFVPGLVDWLGDSCGLVVRQVRHGDQLAPGTVLVAPSRGQTTVEPGGRLHIGPDDDGSLHGPSVGLLFSSALRSFGTRAVGVLLSGMGRDGAEELAMMRRAGAFTAAQDAASSVVHGMPGEAISLGGAELVGPPERIAAALLELATAAQHDRDRAASGDRRAGLRTLNGGTP